MTPKINNMDIAGICDRIATYANSMINSQSAFNPDYFIESDKIQCATYLDKLETLISIISANAPMDLPKANGTGNHGLKEFPIDEILESVENQDIRDILRRFRAMWIDLSSCRSSDLSSGLNQYDLQIFTTLINSCRQILELSSVDTGMPASNPVSNPANDTGSGLPIDNSSGTPII